MALITKAKEVCMSMSTKTMGIRKRAHKMQEQISLIIMSAKGQGHVKYNGSSDSHGRMKMLFNSQTLSYLWVYLQKLLLT
jgi:hypothetical protein